MTEEPRLPKEPTFEALRAMHAGIQPFSGLALCDLTRAYHALFAHLAKSAVAPLSRRLPLHINIEQMGTNPNHVIEACAEALVRAGMMTVGGAIGDRINRRIAESAKPLTKTVEVWRVEYASEEADGWEAYTDTLTSETHARRIAEKHRKFGDRCIRVTGPHQQEIPA